MQILNIITSGNSPTPDFLPRLEALLQEHGLLSGQTSAPKQTDANSQLTVIQVQLDATPPPLSRAEKVNQRNQNATEVLSRLASLELDLEDLRPDQFDSSSENG